MSTCLGKEGLRQERLPTIFWVSTVLTRPSCTVRLATRPHYQPRY